MAPGAATPSDSVLPRSWVDSLRQLEIPVLQGVREYPDAHMLSKRDKAVLDFERSWWLLPGPKDRAVQEHLGMSAGRYYRILRDLLDDPEAQLYDPLTVRRLLKVRTQRTRRQTEPRIIADGLDPADI